MRRIGPIFDLGDGTRLQDVDAGCGDCGKRLAVVVFDPEYRWRRDSYVCISCGTEARVR